LPELAWSPPEPAAAPIDGLPPHQDTTTARRLASSLVLDAAGVGVGLSVAAATASLAGRAQGDASGEIIIPDGARPEIPVVRGEVVIEAVLPSLAPLPFGEEKAGSFFEETRTTPFGHVLDASAAGFDEVSEERTDFEIVIEAAPEDPLEAIEGETTNKHAAVASKPVKQ
jgi:hypothetical protein